MDIKQILTEAVRKGASDVFLISGAALSYKVAGRVIPQNDGFLKPDDTKAAVMEIFGVAGIDTDAGSVRNEMDFSFSIAGTGRFRANIYRQRGACLLNYPTLGHWDFPTRS